MKALCVGKSFFNITYNIEKYPEEGNTYEYKDITEYGSGNAPDSAYLLGKYKVDTYVGSIVGDDTYGNLIRKELDKVGVHTEYMEIAYDKRTPSRIVMLNTNNKTKTVIGISKDELQMKKIDFQMNPDLVLVDCNDYGAALAAINKYGDKLTIIAAKEANAETLELCKYGRYILCSKEFASKVSGIKIDFKNPNSLVSAYSNLLNKFPNKNLVVTLGEKGALYTINNQIKVMPGLKTEMVDNTGAGDIFNGAFAYGLLKEYDIEKAITFANIAAGLSVVTVGGRTSVPEITDVMKYFNQKYAPEENTPQTPPIGPTTAGQS